MTENENRLAMSVEERDRLADVLYDAVEVLRNPAARQVDIKNVLVQVSSYVAQVAFSMDARIAADKDT